MEPLEPPLDPPLIFVPNLKEIEAQEDGFHEF